MSWSFGVRRSNSRATKVAIAAAFAASAAVSCTKSSEANTEVETAQPELAALLADGELPAEMMPPPTMPPPAPPRFCDVQTQDGGMPVPPRPPMPGFPPGPPVAGGGAGEADGGVAVPEPGCASTPIGFWRFDDCNAFRTELQDSSFEGHAAFRSVDLECKTGQEGFGLSFAREEDLVFVPDQPAFSLHKGVTVAAWVNPTRVDGTSTLFRKREDADSAFALMIHKKRYQFVVRLTSGRLATVSTPAVAGVWTHVAATYDGEYLRLYIDGAEKSRTFATGTLVRGAGPLLIGNDGTERRLSGRIDSAWFNTEAAPAEALLSLTCLRQDPAVSVTPAVGPTVAAGTPVTYSLSIENKNPAVCGPASFFLSVGLPQSDFTSEPQFEEFVVATGQTHVRDVVVQSGTETEAGTYTLNFSVVAQEGGFGGPGFPGPIGRPVPGIGPGVAVAEEAEEDEPLPGPRGFIDVMADYVVAEPEGCHVSPQRALMIRHVSVVDDPVRTTLLGPADNPNTGVWSFGRLMENLSPAAADAADVTEAMFRSFLSTQTINGFEVGPRNPMEPLVLAPWPRTADGKLDLARAPLRLLAITHRLDLKELQKGKGGEGRFTYGVIGPQGFPLEFTVILEYMLPAQNDEEYLALAQSFHALQELPFPSEEYNQALQVVTERYIGRNALPGMPNGSALIDIRTNELSLSEDGQWQLREFRIPAEGGFLAPHPVFQTADASFNFGEPLGRFINQNESIILTEFHEVPSVFEEQLFQAGAIFNNIDFWDAPGITNPEARHKFSLNTCNGCHGAETGTGFLHVFPREVGQQSTLSGFLTGIEVFDPVTGTPRRLNELARRRGLLESVVCEGQE